MSKTSERGVWRAVSPARRGMSDLLHFAKQIPSIPVARLMRLGSVARAREMCPMRPSWTAVFMKAYGRVCQQHPRLRQTLIPWPWEHLYEHPLSVCLVAIEREHCGENILLPAQVRSPETQPLTKIDAYLRRCKHTPIEEIGYFRRTFDLARWPRPVRYLLWWITLNFSGYKRAKRLGTFGLSSYGSLGAEQIHPLIPQTTLLTFGPVSPCGEVVVKIVYDHRVLDGADIARRLAELETILNTEMVAELNGLAGGDRPHHSDASRGGGDIPNQKNAA